MIDPVRFCSEAADAELAANLARHRAREGKDRAAIFMLGDLIYRASEAAAAFGVDDEIVQELRRISSRVRRGGS